MLKYFSTKFQLVYILRKFFVKSNSTIQLFIFYSHEILDFFMEIV